MKLLARLFSYTRRLEELLDKQIALRVRTEEQHHAEFDLLRRDVAREQQRAVSAESRAELLREELERANRWIDKLSDQNFDLTDRLLLKAGVVPTSEPLRSDPQTSNSDGIVDLVDQSVRRTGPVATRRQQVGAAFMAAKNRLETEDRRPPAHVMTSAAAAAAEVADA